MALTDEETLYNQALGLIGEYEVTTSTASTEKQYELCSRFYALARDEVLVAHPWNEAIERAMIINEDTDPLFEYDYRYALPSDCLRVLRIGTYKSYWDEAWEVEGGYVLTDYGASPPEYGDSGIDYVAGQYIDYDSTTYLVDTSFTSGDYTQAEMDLWGEDETKWTNDRDSYLTSQGDSYKYIKLAYVKQLTTISSFSPRLKNAIAHKLATKIVTAITNNPQHKISLLNEYEQLVMPQARSIDAQQGRPRDWYNSKWVRSRW